MENETPRRSSAGGNTEKTKHPVHEHGCPSHHPNPRLSTMQIRPHAPMLEIDLAHLSFWRDSDLAHFAVAERRYFESPRIGFSFASIIRAFATVDLNFTSV